MFSQLSQSYLKLPGAFFTAIIISCTVASTAQAQNGEQCFEALAVVRGSAQETFKTSEELTQKKLDKWRRSIGAEAFLRMAENAGFHEMKPYAPTTTVRRIGINEGKTVYIVQGVAYGELLGCRNGNSQ